jgi:Pentapeptide repeats (8 copies)
VQAALTVLAVLGRQPSMTSSQPPNLSDTDLRRADLSNADLQATRLLGTRLQGANLRAAQLQRVNLRHAQLYGARSSAKTVLAGRVRLEGGRGPAAGRLVGGLGSDVLLISGGIASPLTVSPRPHPYQAHSRDAFKQQGH